jgi:UDP-N-acetylmuramoyl-tripeptide--D-alanyl-D-alanine ligase
MHNVLNALAAFSVGIMAEIEPEKIIEKLAEFIPSGLRQSIVKKGEQTVIIDCYNAAPDSMKASLAILSELSPMPGGRRIAVLGDMLELGSMSQKLHEQVGEYVFNSKTDILVCYGNDSKYIAEKAKELGLLNSRFFSDKSETVSYLKERIKKNDLLLFKASRGIKLEEVIEEIYK